MIGAKHILNVLNDHSVDYVVIGALGAMLHGSPLRTDDLDICPSRDSSNLDRLGEVLHELNAREWDPRKDEYFERDFSAEFFAGDRLFLLITEFGALDLVFEPTGTGGYDDLIQQAVEIDVEGLMVPTASLGDIIRSKEATDRESDREQLPTLRRLWSRLQESGEA
ncbi:MAG: hypothetical protein M3280_10450 [Actinomycetota bacterium]|nr:hypothetical protein [Actinomycetota bacterium]